MRNQSNRHSIENCSIVTKFIIFSQGFLFDKKERNCFHKNQSNIEEKSPLSSNDFSPVVTGQERPNVNGPINGPINGPVRLGTEGRKMRPTSLNIPNHLGVKHETEKLFQECNLKPCAAEQGKPRLTDGNRKAENAVGCEYVQREEAYSPRASELETQQCGKPVCKDCCKSMSAMENKLENLSACLERLETKFSADVEAIFALLRSRRGQKDFHTQV